MTLLLRNKAKPRMLDGGQESDEILLQKIAAGNAGAFSLLVNRHADRFYAVAWRLCANKHDAQDVVQEAFLKLWQFPEKFDPGKGAKFTTWFYRVVCNVALDGRRKSANRRETEVSGLIADSGMRQDEVLQMSEDQLLLERAIADLPEKQRAALNLCFYEGLSNAEAAGILGIRIKALESLLMRGKAGVRDRLIRSGVL